MSALSDSRLIGTSCDTADCRDTPTNTTHRMFCLSHNPHARFRDGYTRFTHFHLMTRHNLAPVMISYGINVTTKITTGLL